MAMTSQMRMEQKMKLAPRMIQSMEVLQLPLLALQEKIEAELNSNPVLELAEPAPEDAVEPTEQEESADTVEQKELVVQDDIDRVDDFQRLGSISDDYQDYMESTRRYNYRQRTSDPDKKLEALQNTADFGKSLNDHLKEQFRLVDTDPKVKKAGELIIDYIDDKGYLTVRLEQLHNKDKHDFGIEHLNQALDFVQRLEPAGVGARDLRDCLLIQMAQFPEDMSFEVDLVTSHWNQLLENKLPQIAKKMNCDVEQINKAILRMSKLDTSPGLQVGRNQNHPITADVIVESDGKGSYIVSLTDTRVPNLRVNNFYTKMSRDKNIDNNTRQFLQQNIRSARWFMDAIEQRKHTLLNVASVIVDHQKEFFDKGKLHLKPLPMSAVADKVGVHIATVSRAVAGKYVQSPQGILPLRSFFKGGMETEDGKTHSWDAVKAKLQEIVNAEDKSKPFSDDDLRKKLAEVGLGNIARRTVAKYRKLLNIPTARFRKKF
jgi:RNA polymerase sigma-54 factor